MKVVFLGGLILLLVLGLTLFVGCGEDDPASSVELTAGSLEDPTFEVVSEFVGEGNFEFDMLLLQISFGLLEEHFEAKGLSKLAAAGSDTAIINSISHDSSNNWHIFTIDVELLEVDEYDDTASFHFLGTDSLRLGYPEGYSYDFDSVTIISLDMHAHFEVDFDASGDWALISDHSLTTITTGGGTNFPLTINGSIHDTIDVSVDSDSGFCEASLYYQQTLINLVIDSLVMDGDECPPSGTANFAFSFDVSCQGTDEYDSLNFAGDWSAAFVFENDMINARFENPTTYWTFEDQCRGFATGKRGWIRIFDALK